MSERLVTLSLLVVAAIHLLPLGGALGVGRLETLYGVTIEGRDLEILMRHRAVLFGILGASFAYAAFTPAVQPLAFAVAAASIGSFLWLAFSVGDFNEALRRVVIADVVAALALALGLTARLLDGPSG